MTVIAQKLAEIDWSLSDFCRRADFHLANGCRIVNGTAKSGPVVRARAAAALGLPEEQLFDARGWPLEVEALPEAS